jgi:hypothetical protein
MQSSLLVCCAPHILDQLSKEGVSILAVREVADR